MKVFGKLATPIPFVAFISLGVGVDTAMATSSPGAKIDTSIVSTMPEDFGTKKMSYTDSVEKAVNKFNLYTRGIYTAGHLKRTGQFLRELTDAVRPKLTPKSTPLDAIREIHQAEVDTGNFEYVADANVIQAPDAKKITMDCNMQSITYLMVLESLAREFPNIDVSKIHFKATLDHAFLEVDSEAGSSVVEVAHPDRFLVMNALARPPAYDNARTLTGDEITADMLEDFANDIKDNLDSKAMVLLQASELDPKAINPLYNLASVFEEKEEYKNALLSIDGAINLGKQYENLYLRRAIIQINSSGLFEDPVSQKKISIEEDNSDSQVGDKSVSDREKVQSAIKKAHLKKIKVSNSAREMRVFRGKNKKKIDEILADFDNAIKINPDFLDAYLNRATFYAMIGDLQKAAADNEKTESLLASALENILKNGALPNAPGSNPFKGSSLVFGPVVAPNPQDAFREYTRIKTAASKVHERIRDDADENGQKINFGSCTNKSKISELEKQLEEISKRPMMTKIPQLEGPAKEVNYIDLPSSKLPSLDPARKAKEENSEFHKFYRRMLKDLEDPMRLREFNIKIMDENRYMNNRF